MQFIGNAWTLPSLQAIIALGMVLSLVPTASLFFFDDDKTLGHESEALLESAEPGEAGLTVAVRWQSQLIRPLRSGHDLPASRQVACRKVGVMWQRQSRASRSGFHVRRLWTD